MSASGGKSGGRKGLPHLRQILEKLKADVIQVEVSVPYADKAFDSQGNLKDQGQKKNSGSSF